jgi:hypothetical protein
MNGRAWWVVAVVASGCGVVDSRALDLCEVSQPADFAFTGTVRWAGFGPMPAPERSR